MPTDPTKLRAEVRELAAMVKAIETTALRDPWDRLRIEQLARGALALCDAVEAAEAERDRLRLKISRADECLIEAERAGSMVWIANARQALAATPPTEEPERP